MNKVFLQLGSNLGEREQLISSALTNISSQIGTIITQSKIYESTPWRVDGQENYLNQVIEIKTQLPADKILEMVLNIENDLGRVRLEKWGERLIDIDIIFFNNDIIESPALCVPHKHMHERNFVLEPLNEIAPEFVHPKYNKTISTLFKESKDTEKVVVYAV